jgi:putative intracellular protease/amidase
VQIAILLFDGFAALDAVALHNALSSAPRADITFAALRPGSWRDETRQLELTADASLSEIPRPDLLVVPGGSGARTAAGNRAIGGWLGSAAASARTVAVSDGVLILGRAGLLHGRRVAAPARLHGELAALGAVPTAERLLIDGRLATAATAEAATELTSLLLNPSTNTKDLPR